jgi:hypothetical protein
LLFFQQVRACQVPVFRYALERWQADKYHAVIIHQGTLDEEQKSALQIIEEAGSPLFGTGANLALRKLDLSSGPSPDPRWQSESSTFKPDDPPRVALYYPSSTGIEEPLWTGDLTIANAKAIIDSPLRQKIKDELLAGTSNVWLLLQGGDESLDRKAEERLRKFLAQASSETNVPDGIIPLEQAHQIRSGPDEGPIDMDDVLRSSVPLKIHFSTLAVSRNDPAEEIFISMLLNHSPRMRSITGQPIAIPIFGRGRMLEGMIGEDITLEHTLGASSYLCSACSCQVKEENPGLDMLMAVKWDDHMLGSLIIEDRVLPPLEGIGELIRPDSPLSSVQNQTTKERSTVNTGLIVAVNPDHPSPTAHKEEPLETQGKTTKNSSVFIGLIVLVSVLAILVFSSLWATKTQVTPK